MSIAVYVRDRDGSERVIPIAGASELASRWRPIIAARGLRYLDYMLSAGLSIDSDNHADVLAEIETLCRELAAAKPPELPTQSPPFASSNSCARRHQEPTRPSTLAEPPGRTVASPRVLPARPPARPTSALRGHARSAGRPPDRTETPSRRPHPSVGNQASKRVSGALMGPVK